MTHDGLIQDLRDVAANARTQLGAITPRHRRYAMYYKTAQAAEAAIEALSPQPEEAPERPEFRLDARPFILVLGRLGGFSRERVPEDYPGKIPLAAWKWEPRPGCEQDPGRYSSDIQGAYDAVTAARKKAAEALRKDTQWDPVRDEKDLGAPWND